MTTDREADEAKRTVKRMAREYAADSPRGLLGTRVLVVLLICVAVVGGLFGASLLVSSTGESADSLNGRVISIADGDTFTLLDATNRQVKVRLAEIDTPEKGQPYANRARQALSGMVYIEPLSERPLLA